MSVYVDKAENAYGRMVMCHMIADTPQELLEMVRKIEVNPKWFQCNASVPHFDIAKSKKALAIQNGAIELDRREYVKAFQRIRLSWPRTATGAWSFPSSPPPGGA